MPLRRRTYLAAVGATLAVAGCSGRSESGSDGDTLAEGDTPTTATPDDSTTPVPSDRFADEPCPSFTDTDRTVCAHTHRAAALWLDADTKVFQFDPGNDTVETIAFTLHNESEREFRFNPFEWGVKRKHRDAWTHVAPDEHTESLTGVAPGETSDWVLSRRDHPTPGGGDTVYPTVAVEDGRHAFTVEGFFPDREASVECIALFDVQGISIGAGDTPTPL